MLSSSKLSGELKQGENGVCAIREQLMHKMSTASLFATVQINFKIFNIAITKIALFSIIIAVNKNAGVTRGLTFSGQNKGYEQLHCCLLLIGAVCSFFFCAGVSQRELVK